MLIQTSIFNADSNNPNWPSQNPGKSSGGGRGNNPPGGGKK